MAAINHDDNACLEHLRKVLEASGGRRKGVVMEVYLEHFKQFRDTYGYEGSEQLLHEIQEYLEELTESAVYRYIGVEFVVILEQTGYEQAQALAEEICERFIGPWNVGKTQCTCVIDIGLCVYPGLAMTPSKMIQCLDRAVMESAALGPNQITAYDSELEALYARKQKIAISLEEAMEKHTVGVRFRPTCHMKNGRFTRAEFYLRFFVQDIGFVGMDEFMPIAEDTGQIRRVQYYSLEQVCSLIAELVRENIEFESVALRVSPVIFLQEDFIREITRLKELYRIPDGKLALEVTESVLITANLNASIAMQELSELGVELILNEFGTGHSGVGSVLELPLDVLKLERSFVWQLETDPRAQYVIGGLIRMAEDLGIKLIAEGVETENQLQILESFGCEYEQGFYYSPTVEKDCLKKILGKSPQEAAEIIRAEKEAAKEYRPRKR